LAKTIELANLLEYLEEHDFVTSRLQPDSNRQFVRTWNNKPILIKKYIEGNIIENIPAEVAGIIGRELGKLHQIKAPNFLSGSFNYAQDFFDEVKTYEPKSSFYQWLSEIKKYVNKYITDDLPKALIHSDIFFSNVIIRPNNKKVVIMDFEEACYYYRLFDIGMAIVGLCCQNGKPDMKKISSFMNGYKEIIRLCSDELKALQAFIVYASAAIAFWRHRQFRFIYPDTDLYEHYMPMKELADHVKRLPNIDFNQAL